MFTLNSIDELTVDKLSKILQRFNTVELPKLQNYYNYYNGKQAIMNKRYTDTTKPCNRVVTNYCSNITNNYLGYLTGVPIAYTSNSDITNIQDILNYNDIKNTDTELLKQALIYGVAVEINYIDEDKKQRFKVLDSRECIPVYDNTLNNNLLCAIRFYLADTLDFDKGYNVEVYTTNAIFIYQCSDSFSDLHLIETKPHYFKQVPVTVFSLNAEQDSIFANIVSLQDAYNSLLSCSIDDWETFADAYMVLKGVTADNEDIANMKQNRVLLLDADSEAEYLTKEVNDAQIQNLLKDINDNIHKIANSPDFADEKFMATSGIAMKFKMIGMENTASAIVNNMIKALQKRIELIATILNMTSEAVWRDIDIVFTRNLPINTVEIAQVINTLRGIVSNKSLLSQLPFINDVQAELDALAEEQSLNAELYSFNSENKVGE